MRRKIMVVGAHADDIEINTGGLLSKYLGEDYELVYIMSTNNMSGQFSWLDEDGNRRSRREVPCGEMIVRRKQECDAAAKELGTVPIHLDHPQRHYRDDDGKYLDLDYGTPRPSVAQEPIPNILLASEDEASRTRLKNLILEHNPEVIFSHGIADRNIEHMGSALLVTCATIEAVKEGFNGSLLHWREGHTFLGETNVAWDTYIDYTGHVDRKMELIGIHNCQMPTWQDPNFGHRTRAREFGKMCGCEAAELFVWVRRPDHLSTDDKPYGSLTLELIHNSR